MVVTYLLSVCKVANYVSDFSNVKTLKLFRCLPKHDGVKTYGGHNV